MADQASSQGNGAGRPGLQPEAEQAPPAPSTGALFAAAPAERTSGGALPWVIAGAAVLLVLALLLLLGRHRQPDPADSGAAGPDAYAPSLAVSGIAMSESTSLSGGKSTYIDGHIRNTGNRTVTAATVQVVFGNDEALPPQVETLPLTLIRAHEPYVDTEPVSAAPLGPGEDREFRLIFEDIRSNWNQHLPEIRVLRVHLR